MNQGFGYGADCSGTDRGVILTMTRKLAGLAKRVVWEVAPSILRARAKPATWPYAISIYSGNSPFELKPDPKAPNPVISYQDVTDTLACAVADPFLFQTTDGWHLFFEVVSQLTWRGEIAYASSSDGYDWKYQSLLIQEPFHMSYPYVFEWDGEHYMIPETGQANSIRLYRASRFPDRWEFMTTLLDGSRFVDTSVFQHDGRWWMFTDTGEDHMKPKLRLFYAETLTGPWSEHPSSPISDNDMKTGRPGGRVVHVDGNPVRFNQFLSLDTSVTRGIWAAEVMELTESSYEERLARQQPVLTGGAESWNKGGIHHVDPHEIADGQWFACVDVLPERN